MSHVKPVSSGNIVQHHAQGHVHRKAKAGDFSAKLATAQAAIQSTPAAEQAPLTKAESQLSSLSE
jgi:hypothetical protein